MTAIIWAVSLMQVGTIEVQAQSAQSIAKTAFGSTVLLVMEDSKDAKRRHVLQEF